MKQGDEVDISFFNNQTMVIAQNYPLVLTNPDASVRVLLANETLILDSLVVSLDTVTVGGVLQVFSAPPANSTNVGLIVARFGTFKVDSLGNPIAIGTDNVQYRNEGLSLPPGQTLWVVAPLTGGSAAISGKGRIITSSTQIGRQNWQAKLNP